MSQSNPILLYMIAAILIVHGLGHSGGYWMLVNSWAGESLERSPFRLILVATWLIAMLGFLAAGIGLLAHQSWWGDLAVISACISLPATLLFFRFNLNLVGALIVDVSILTSLLWIHWPALNAFSS